jgi:glutamate-1-semialdehyde aminotransferase/spore coat polysaccharide biosynthesis protein SpsF (cytidylyltransferase family)
LKTVAIIQARMGSTRLPGKVLMPLAGRPVLHWCVRAAKKAPGVDEVWVATTTEAGDNKIVEWCRKQCVNFFRGPETDVLSRFMGCARAAEADIILRLTGDCPFLDPQVIGAVVRLIKDTHADYASNVSPRTYPDGLDVEAFTMNALQTAHREATRAIDRDCVTPYIERNRDRFPAETVINPIPGLSGERWVLDTEADFKFCEAIARRWPWDHGPASMLGILNILDLNPELREINKHHPCNERFFEALAAEPVYRRRYDRSQEALRAARDIIPLGAQTFSKSHLQFPQPSPLFVSHGQGAEIFDIDGNAYIDLMSALLPTILGYRDPDVDYAIRRQLGAGISFSLATRLEEELASLLVRLIPCAEAVRFGKTGTDATTAAVRAARAHTGRDRVLIHRGGYHGWADWSVERNLGVPQAVRDLTDRVAYGDWPCPDLEQYAAIIVEPEGNPDKLRWLRGACDHSGAVLIFDEVITGFRFHLGGAQALYGVTPDLATFGKSMANGMPLSAVVGRKDIMKRFEPPDNIFYSGTFFGETLSLAAAIATIKKLERGELLCDIEKAGFWLAAQAKDMIFDYGMAEYIQFVGHPSFKRIKFSTEEIAALFRKEMISTGTLLTSSHNVGACHGPNEMERILASYQHTLSVMRTAIDKGTVGELLAGASVSAGVRPS